MNHPNDGTYTHVVDHSSGVAITPTPDDAPVGRLRREHDDVSRLLASLESQLTLVHAAGDGDCAMMREVVSFLTEYIDAVHHTREELVMAELVANDPSLQVIADTLRSQHDTIARRGLLLQELLDCALADAPVERRSIAHLGFAYTAELRRNMAVEEALVFPLAVARLGPAQWAGIDAKLADGAEALLDEVTARYRDFIDQLPPAGCGCA